MHSCPKCHHDVRQTHRRSIDYFICRIHEVRRFRCPQCGWTGNLRHTSVSGRKKPGAILLLGLFGAVGVGLMIAVALSHS